MTVWFVIPKAQEAAFRALYLGERVRGRDNPGRDERVGVMMPSRDGAKLMTGTTRMTGAVRRALAGRKPPWLEIFTEFPPPAAWSPPVVDTPP